MLKRCGIFLVAVFAAACFYVPAAFSGQPGQCGSCDDLKAQLNNVQAQKEQVAKEYQASVDTANSEADTKMRQIKADCRKVCNDCAVERDAKCKKMKEEYGTKMQPLSAQEQQIRSQMAPKDRFNFAKPKYERKS